MKSNIISKLFFGLLIAASFVGATSVWAEGNTEAPDIHPLISPVSERIDNLEPGQEYDGAIKVSNTGRLGFDFKVYASPYNVEDLTYLQMFRERSSYNKIVGWISFEQEEYQGLEPGKAIEVPYHISVPLDAPGGAQYAVIFIETVDDSNATKNSIQTISRLGYTIYAQVSGDTREGGELVSLEQKRLIFEPPIRSSVVIKNTGNVDFSSSHTMTIESIYGKELYKEKKDHMILADTSRQIEYGWEDAPFIGIFKVTNEVEFLDNVQLSDTRMVLVMPVWLIILIIVALLLMVVAIFSKIAKTKRSKGIVDPRVNLMEKID